MGVKSLAFLVILR